MSLDMTPFEVNDQLFHVWFKRAADQVIDTKEKPHEFEAGFMKCRTNRERVAFLLEDPQSMGKIQGMVASMKPDRDGEERKSSSTAAAARVEGNALFKARKLGEALEKYSEAILWAPHEPSSEELSLCFANRSAAFFELKRFEDSLLDIEEALTRSYPKERVLMLLIRKLKCLKSLGRDEDAKSSLDEFNALLKEGQKISGEILVLMKEIESVRILERSERQVPISITLKEPNERLFGANKCIKMGYELKKGRTIEATREIEEGEVLVVEEAYVSWLAPTCYPHYCHHCVSQLSCRFIPCSRCPSVRFCSKKCLNESWRQYHEKECLHLDTLKFYSLGLMAIRMAIVAGIDEILNEDEEEDSDPLHEWPAKDFQHNWSSVSSLVSKSDGYSFETLLYYSLAAAVFGLFAEKMLLTREKSRQRFGGLMLKHFFQITQNAHAIYAFNLKATQYKGLYFEEAAAPEVIGSGLFPTASLVNHNCNPNARQLTVGSKIVAVALRDIEAGAEVSVTYGPTIKSTPFRPRQAYLERYCSFRCECDACLNREECWPYYRCPKCGGNLVPPSPGMSINICTGCETIDQDLSDLLRDHKKADDLLEKSIDCCNRGLFEEAEALALEAETLCNKVLQEGCPQHERAKETLSLIYQYRDDPNFEFAFKYRTDVLAIEKVRSGVNSCRVVYHLIKMILLLGEKCGRKGLTGNEKEQCFVKRKEYEDLVTNLFAKIDGMQFKTLTMSEISAYSHASDLYIKKRSHANS